MRLPDGTVRKLRKSVNEPGHAHELTFCCHRGMRLLERDRVRMWFVDALDRARHLLDFELWAYVIMPEHAHILILPQREAYDTGAVLKSVKQSVSRRAVLYLRKAAPAWLERLKVTRPTGKAEHRFWQQGGGYDRNFDRAPTAWQAVDYIHNDPVRRGLADCPTDWPWSSARWYAGLDGVILEMDAAPPVEHVR